MAALIFVFRFCLFFFLYIVVWLPVFLSVQRFHRPADERNKTLIYSPHSVAKGAEEIVKPVTYIYTLPD